MNDKDINYYTITPAIVRRAKINGDAKLLYGDILTLSLKNGYCFASNSYFAEFYQTSKSVISRRIKILKEAGFIETQDVFNGKEIVLRKIYPAFDTNSNQISGVDTDTEPKSDIGGIADSVTGVLPEQARGVLPVQATGVLPEQAIGYCRNRQRYNTSINKQVNNIKDKTIVRKVRTADKEQPKINELKSNDPKPKPKSKPVDTFKSDRQNVVKYLNDTLGTRYRPNSKTTRRVIDARLNDGFKADDLKRVIDIKANDWLSKPDMAKYLRPETLFGNKFESYLNQPLKNKSSFYDDEDKLPF